MNRYEYRGQWYTPNQLSEMSGIAAHTIRDRIRRGFSIEEAVKPVASVTSVLEFAEASYWGDWVGISTREVYEVYWKWCMSNDYQPVTLSALTRQLLGMYPMLKTVPSRCENGGCGRIIRVKEAWDE